MRILLVQPKYNMTYPPLSLMRISSYHKSKGDEVEFVHGEDAYRGDVDLIYITSHFTYHWYPVCKAVAFYANNYPKAKVKVGGIFISLMPEFARTQIGGFLEQGNLLSATHKPEYEIFKGQWAEIEQFKPDYDLIPPRTFLYDDQSITTTTKGCSRHCPWCVVPIVDPGYSSRHWTDDIDNRYKTISFWDNNWFAKSYRPKLDDAGNEIGWEWDDDNHKLWLEDVRLIKKIGKAVDFNQANDCRLFTREHVEALKGVKMRPVRFAFDSMAQDGSIQQAIKWCQEELNANDIRVYVLYNFNDKPEQFYYRIDQINKLSAKAYPMKFKPIKDVSGAEFVGRHWIYEGDKKTNWLLWNTQYLCWLAGGRRSTIIPNMKRELFLDIFGNNAEEFERKISTVHLDRQLTEIIKRKNKEDLWCILEE